MATEKNAAPSRKPAAKAPRAGAASPRAAAREDNPKASREDGSKQASPVDAGGQGKRRQIVGLVVSDKMKKTLVVKVDRRVRHGLYGKYLTRSRRFKAHDEKNEARVGDLVSLVESRPLSRDKRWALREVLRKGGGAAEVTV